MRNCASTYGELVHTDLWGPAQTESVAGHLYYISFTNNFSRETKVHFLKLKSEALSALKDYETELRRQTPGAKIKKLHSDRGGEYHSTEFDRYLKDQGIKHQLTVHHSPQQNGVTERLNHTLVEHARAMSLGRDM
jgi:transposase InsO family protein